MQTMLRCLCCGAGFSPAEAKEVSECIGEYWGTPAFETFQYCPKCDEDAIEVMKKGDRKYKIWGGSRAAGDALMIWAGDMDEALEIARGIDKTVTASQWTGEEYDGEHIVEK